MRCQVRSNPMSINLLRSQALLIVLCCQVLALRQTTTPPSRPNVPAQQQTNPNTPPAANQPATQPPADQPGQVHPVRPKVSQTPREQAWQIIEDAVASDKTADRATAVLVLGLVPNDARSARMAEKALADDKPEVRTAAAVALGEMKSRADIPKLRAAIDDPDPTVVLAAAHSLDLMHDKAAFEVYYEVLNGERKATGGMVSSKVALLHDPKKMAQLGLEEGLGFVPFAGIGWGAIKALAKDDTSPVRAAAAKVLARDPDPASKKALIDATGDNSWIVQAAAIEALAKRGDRSTLNVVERYMSDEKNAVKYTAAVAVIRLSAMKGTDKPGNSKSGTNKSGGLF
jgi:HEAT repeat protein